MTNSWQLSRIPLAGLQSGNILAPTIQLVWRHAVFASDLVLQFVFGPFDVNHNRQAPVLFVFEADFDGSLSGKIFGEIADRTLANLRAVVWRRAFAFNDLKQNRSLSLFMSLEDALRGDWQWRISRDKDRVAFSLRFRVGCHHSQTV